MGSTEEYEVVQEENQFDPTKKRNAIGMRYAKPEKNGVYLYYESKSAKTTSKPPVVDSPRANDLECYHAHMLQEHDLMLAQDKETNDNRIRQEKINAIHINAVDKKFAHIRHRFIEVNAFMKECQEKKKLAEKKVISERILHNEMRTEIHKLSGGLHLLKQFNVDLRDTAEEYICYENCINDVIKKSHIGYISIKDCMDRCDGLMLGQLEMVRMQKQKLREIEFLRNRLITISKQSAQAVLGWKNELLILQREYDEAHQESLKWEKMLVDTSKSAVELNDLNKDRTLDGVANLYRLLCIRRGMEPVFYRHEVEEQMDFIKEEMELLKEVYKTYVRSHAVEGEHIVFDDEDATKEYC